MLSIPASLVSSARGGQPPFMAVEIFGNAGDTWPDKRFATAQGIVIDGNEYLPGYLKSTTRICESAALDEEAGGVAAPEAVTVTLLNKDGFLDALDPYSLVNRLVHIHVGVVPPNRLPNSSFEEYAAGDFAHWTKTVPTGGAVAQSASFFHGASSAQLTGGTSLPTYLTSDEFTVKNGESVTVSLYAYGGAGRQVLVAFKFGSSFWWNPASRTFSMSRVWTTVDVTTAAWTRVLYDGFSWADWVAAGGTHASELACKVEVGCPSGKVVEVDAAMFEASADYSPEYCAHRGEMVSGDLVLKFVGRCKQVSWNKRRNVRIEAESVANDRYKMIPRREVSASCDPGHSELWLIPEDALGKPFPMTYGHFIAGPFYHWDPRIDASLDYTSLARAILVNCNPDADIGPLAYIDRPGRLLATLTPAPPTGSYYCRMWHWNTGAKHFYHELWNDDAAPLNPDGTAGVAYEWYKDLANARVYMDANAYHLKDSRAPWSLYWNAATHKGASGFVNPYYSRDVQRYATGASYSGVGPGIYMSARGQSHELINTDVVAIYGVFDVSSNPSSTGNVAYAMVINHMVGRVPFGSASVPLCSVTPGQRKCNLPWGHDAAVPNPNLAETLCPFNISSTVDLDFMRKVIDQRYMRINGTVSGGAVVTYVWEWGLRVDFATDVLSAKMCYEGYGRAWDATHGGRHTVGAVIRNAEDVVEDILCELDIADADIDQASFDAVASSRYLAGQVLEKRRGINVIDDVCRDGLLLYYVTGGGKHRVVDMNLSRFKALAPAIRLTGRDFVGGEDISIELTDREKVVNNVKLRYNKHPWEDDYRAYAYVSKDSTNYPPLAAYEAVCQASYDELGGIEVEKTFDAPWLKWPTWASWKVINLLYWLGFQRLVVDATVTAEWVGLELGDVVSLDLPGYLPASAALTPFLVTRTSLKELHTSVGVELTQIRTDVML